MVEEDLEDGTHGMSFAKSMLHRDFLRGVLAAILVVVAFECLDEDLCGVVESSETMLDVEASCCVVVVVVSCGAEMGAATVGGASLFALGSTLPSRLSVRTVSWVFTVSATSGVSGAGEGEDACWPSGCIDIYGQYSDDTRKEVGERFTGTDNLLPGAQELNPNATAGKMSNPSHVLIARSSRSSQPVRPGSRKSVQKLNSQFVTFIARDALFSPGDTRCS